MANAIPSPLKIDMLVWNDARFRQLWTARFDSSVRVPKSHGWPLDPKRYSQCELARLTLRHRFKKERRQLLPLVTDRLGSRCLSCGSPGSLVLDHVIPLCWGGTNDIFNLQPLCSRCNSAKGGALPEPPHA